MEKEWKALAEQLLFDLGKQVLGKKSGGLIVKLMQSRGINSTRVIILMAARKSDPLEYVGAVLKEKNESQVNVGDCIGNHVWTGSRWKPNEG